MVWFKVDEPEGCKEAPEEVSSEELPKDICADVSRYRIQGNRFLKTTIINIYSYNIKYESYKRCKITFKHNFQAAAKDRQCFCIGWNTTNWHGFEEGLKSTENITYFPWCGECIDPCALRFKWDSHFTIPKGKSNEV